MNNNVKGIFIDIYSVLSSINYKTHRKMKVKLISLNLINSQIKY